MHKWSTVYTCMPVDQECGGRTDEIESYESTRSVRTLPPEHYDLGTKLKPYNYVYTQSQQLFKYHGMIVLTQTCKCTV